MIFFRGGFVRPPLGHGLPSAYGNRNFRARWPQPSVEYTLLDDVHFQSAGFELEQLLGYYIAEDRGEMVKVIPGLKSLRYLLPFREVDETIDFLRGAAESIRVGWRQWATIARNLARGRELSSTLPQWLAGEIFCGA